jgi:hypothetical protein
MANLSNSMILPLLIVASRSLGANNNQALPLVLVASMARSPMMAVVLAAALIRAQPKPTPQAPPAVVIQAIPQGGALVAAPAIALDPADFLRPFGMLSFHGLDKEKAEQLARLLGLNFEFEGDGNVVTRQQPGIGKPRRADNVLRLTFG